MRKSLLFALVLAILTCAIVIRTGSSPKSPSSGVLVADYPDGEATLSWSRDGRFVRVDPLDKRRNLAWGMVYLDAVTHRRVNLESHQAQRLFGQSPFYFGFDANLNQAPLSICQASTGECRPLRAQPPELHRQVIDFDNQRFYRSSSNEIMAVNAGEVLRWSTRTGNLTSRLRLIKKESSGFAVLSPSGRWFVTEALIPDANQGKDLISLFDTHTGQRRFGFSPDPQAVDYGFSPSEREFHLCFSAGDWPNATAIFKNLRNGRTLWQASTSAAGRLAFSKATNVVALRGPQGLEVRDVTSGKLQHSFPLPAHMTDIARLAFSPDDSVIWASCFDNNSGLAQIWSWRVK